MENKNIIIQNKMGENAQNVFFLENDALSVSFASID